MQDRYPPPGSILFSGCRKVVCHLKAAQSEYATAHLCAVTLDSHCPQTFEYSPLSHTADPVAQGSRNCRAFLNRLEKHPPQGCSRRAFRAVAAALPRAHHRAHHRWAQAGFLSSAHSRKSNDWPTRVHRHHRPKPSRDGQRDAWYRLQSGVFGVCVADQAYAGATECDGQIARGVWMRQVVRCDD